jgi:hypothetical protein
MLHLRRRVVAAVFPRVQVVPFSGDRSLAAPVEHVSGTNKTEKK